MTLWLWLEEIEDNYRKKTGWLIDDEIGEKIIALLENFIKKETKQK